MPQKTRIVPGLLQDLLLLAGSSCVVYGVFMIYAPAACIVAGAFCIYAGFPKRRGV